MSTGVAAYYERLSRWNRAAQAFGYGGGGSTLTVHRALADPRAQGRTTFTRLHDVLFEYLPLCPAPRVLDAGCGLGGTLLALATERNATAVGLTLSASQAKTANEAAIRLGRDAQVSVVVRSYDEPPSGPFDVVVAIESLAHSADPARSIAGLVAVLAPGGCIAVVDDMPEDGASSSPDLALFKTGWQCPVLWSARDYRDAFAGAGLALHADVDLSGQCRPRTRAQIARLMAVNRLVGRLPSAALRQIMVSHLGGLALERLTRDNAVRYRLLIARRTDLQVS
jgi:SAM-dependent methyltransferase